MLLSSLFGSISWVASIDGTNTKERLWEIVKSVRLFSAFAEVGDGDLRNICGGASAAVGHTHAFGGSFQNGEFGGDAIVFVQVMPVRTGIVRCHRCGGMRVEITEEVLSVEMDVLVCCELLNGLRASRCQRISDVETAAQDGDRFCLGRSQNSSLECRRMSFFEFGAKVLRPSDLFVEEIVVVLFDLSEKSSGFGATLCFAFESTRDRLFVFRLLCGMWRGVCSKLRFCGIFVA